MGVLNWQRMRRLLITIFINLFIFSVSSFNVYEENEEGSRCLCKSSACFCQENNNDDLDEIGSSKRAFGPVTDLMRVGNYKIDYSQVNPQLHRLLVTKKKQNTNSFFNLLRST